MGRKLRQKNRNPLPFQILQVFLWFLFEFIGGFLYLILFASPGGGQGPLYLCALLGAGSSVALIFFIIGQLPDKLPFRQPGFPIEPEPAAALPVAGDDRAVGP